MKTMKMTGGLAAAVAMLGLSGAAIADHGESCVNDYKLVRAIKATALGLACESSYETLGYPVTDIVAWPSGNPLWQRQAGKLRKKGGDPAAAGCEVHEKLVAKLWVPRPDDTDSRPPRNKKGSNNASGAANAIDPLLHEDLKFETAVNALESFKSSIDSSVPNPGFVTNVPLPASAPDSMFPEKKNPSQDDWERFLKYWADTTISSVKECGHIDP
jgi:hypothetical protein